MKKLLIFLLFIISFLGVSAQNTGSFALRGLWIGSPLDNLTRVDSVKTVGTYLAAYAVATPYYFTKDTTYLFGTDTLGLSTRIGEDSTRIDSLESVVADSLLDHRNELDSLKSVVKDSLEDHLTEIEVLKRTVGDSVLVSAQIGELQIDSSINFAPHADPPSSPVEGDVYYDSDVDSLYIYINSAWVALNRNTGSNFDTTTIYTVLDSMRLVLADTIPADSLMRIDADNQLLWPWVFTDSSQMKDDRNMLLWYYPGPDTMVVDTARCLALTASSTFSYQVYFARETYDGTLDSLFSGGPVIVTGAETTTTGEIDEPGSVDIPPRSWVYLHFSTMTAKPEYGISMNFVGHYR